jgi:hypothetical protein
VLHAVALQLALASTAVAPAAAEAPRFETPDAALEAVRAALAQSDEGEAWFALFGDEHREALIGGDPAEARLGLARMRVGAKEALSWSEEGDERRVLHVGRQAWPLPIPLVRDGEGWRFDALAGLEEIDDRRIGRHELAAIELCREFVEAQVEYATEDRDGDEVLEYAQRLLSESGTQNGLFWPDESGEDPSPLAEFVARAEEYRAHSRLGEPYRGYHFRVLTRQGPTPPGGQYDYVINGNMIAGFALLAWPAEYGRSGIMSFMVNQQGRVHQKDLGAETAQAVESLDAYEPSEGWSEVSED